MNLEHPGKQESPLPMIHHAAQKRESPPLAVMHAIDGSKPLDVLCGRTKHCFHHEGNHRFRQLIAQYADQYRMAETKKAKGQAVMHIADLIIEQGGRFLTYTPDGTWVDGGRSLGRKKIANAFRDALRGRVKCMTQIMNQSDGSFATAPSVGVETYSSEEFSNEELQSMQRSDMPLPADFLVKCLSDDHSIDGEDFNLNSPMSHRHFASMHHTPGMAHEPVEPTIDWKTTTVDKEGANDLLNFFIEDQVKSLCR